MSMYTTAIGYHIYPRVTNISGLDHVAAKQMQDTLKLEEEKITDFLASIRTYRMKTIPIGAKSPVVASGDRQGDEVEEDDKESTLYDYTSPGGAMDADDDDDDDVAIDDDNQMLRGHSPLLNSDLEFHSQSGESLSPTSQE
eukprot:GFYU01005692.1.p1 GENE.GFYU01005692.1~~GFYU01005692.1.p1  ORF type:complete len:163 (+),score=12.36 GFYU01005692.1:68-490(+)